MANLVTYQGKFPVNLDHVADFNGKDDSGNGLLFTIKFHMAKGGVLHWSFENIAEGEHVYKALLLRTSEITPYTEPEGE